MKMNYCCEASNRRQTNIIKTTSSKTPRVKHIWLVVVLFLLKISTTTVNGASFKVRSQTAEDGDSSSSSGGKKIKRTSSTKVFEVLADEKLQEIEEADRAKMENMSLGVNKLYDRFVLFYSGLYQYIRENFYKHYYTGMGIPRDLYHGSAGAIHQVLYKGLWQGFVRVFERGDLLGGVAVMVGGLAAGVHQILAGIANTPAAIAARTNGKSWSNRHNTWEHYSLDRHSREVDQHLFFINQSQETYKNKSHRRNHQQLLRSGRRVKDKTLYNLLSVRTDATRAEIKRAYYKEALHIHPDKNLGKEQQATDKFKQLTDAYQILSNYERRKAYDENGMCQVDGDGGESALTAVDAHEFLAILFESYLFEPYIGELQLTGVVDNLFHLGDFKTKSDNNINLENNNDDDNDDLYQERRMLDIALHLRQRISSFVAEAAGVGVSETQFRASCRYEAQALARGEFGDVFLQSIGKPLVAAGTRYIINHGPAKFALAKRTAHLALTGWDDMKRGYQTTADTLGAIFSIAPKLLQVATKRQKQQKKKKNKNQQKQQDEEEDEANEEEEEEEESSSCDASEADSQETDELVQHLHEKIPELLRLSLRVIDDDINKTIKTACGKLLVDYVPKEIRLKRAQALVILGQEFFETGKQMVRPDRFQDKDGIWAKLLTALETAIV